MPERCDQTDRAVPAHPQVAHIVEEDDAEPAIGAVGFDEQRANDRIRAPRLVDDGRTIGIEVPLKALHPLLERSLPQVGAAIEHQPRGFAAGVRINDAHRERAHGRESRARSIIAITAARRSPDSGRRGGRTRSEPRPMICSASLMD